MDICQNLNSILKKRKITQKELCQQIGITESKLSYWLTKGKSIPSEYIVPICKYLNISPIFIFKNITEVPLVFRKYKHTEALRLNMLNRDVVFQPIQ